MASTRIDAVNGRVAAHVLQGRTDAAGVEQVDEHVDGEDLRIPNGAFTSGVMNPAEGFQVLATSPTPDMNVHVGSGVIGDTAVLSGSEPQQGNYRVSWPDADTTVSVPAADLADPRIDEIYLVVEDNAYDLSGRTLPALFHRDGTPAATPLPPGPDPNWTASLLLAEILVPAAALEITDTEITDRRAFSNLTLGGSRRVTVPDNDPDTTRIDAVGDVEINPGVGAGGVDAVFSTTGLDMRGNDITEVGEGSPDIRFLPGFVTMSGRSGVPDGWLLCDGAAVSRTTFSDLFAAIGTTYGNGNGSTTFNIPNFFTRFPIGASGTTPRGATGGAFDHTHSNPTTGVDGNHNHTNPNTSTTGDHAHFAGTLETGNPTFGGQTTPEAGSLTTPDHDFHTHNVTGTTATNGDHSHTQGNTGFNGDHSHTQGNTGSNNPPYLGIRFLIKT